MADLTVYNLPPSPPKWDRVGVFYISFCSIWTTLLAAGMAFCCYHRSSPILKLRGIPLSFSAIFLLHLYWIMAQITYPIGRTMPTVIAYDVQYFIMGTYFPLGVALFHASNTRLLHVAKMQKRFMHPDLQRKAEGCNGSKTSWLCRLRNAPYTARIILFISFGMVFQAALTIAMWFACQKYHPTYGIPGTEMRSKTLPGQIAELGRGWEWWPSLVWQFVWTWVVAPIMIFRAWKIRDTMGWRVQTIGCCLSGLHATPMFLIASYVPAFEKVNMYFAPSEWIHLFVMIVEIFTVFVPVFQVMRLWVLNKKAADSNARWETSSQTTRSSTTLDWKSGSMSVAEKGEAMDYTDEQLGDRLLTMGALDHVLRENPGPLQHFSALSDFSGENIAFLTYTASWKSSWIESPNAEELLDAYNGGLEIYINFISPRDADFPLNVSSRDLKALEDVFEKQARILCGEASVNAAAPFDASPSLSSQHSHNDLRELAGKARYTGELPAGFGRTIFDTVQSHVKYLVLTNTWPKFVDEMQQRRRSSETGHSSFTFTSQTTLASRVSSRLSAFIHSLF